MKIFLKQKISILILLIAAASLAFFPPILDEGMFLVSDIHKLNLKEKGLKIDPSEIYNPGGNSLIDALVNITGCSGAFVSKEGLILTNHHCVFPALQKAATIENNYVEEGFLARSKEEEIPAQGITCKITQSYRDVSDEIMNSVEGIVDFMKRVELIDEAKKKIIKEEERKDESIRAEISEMFEGRTYFLFTYKVLNDVRIVYAPPRFIGEYGGETDNWVWPRHNGDFAFLRAYCGPNGESAAYSSENIPFKPTKFLKVNPDGSKEGDFAFILGYPGRTFRHKPAKFLEYQRDYLLPFISELYEYQIAELKKVSDQSKENAIKLAARIKSLANVEKNYKGKLFGINRLNLVEKKIEEEKELLNFIKSESALKEKYGGLFESIEINYTKKNKTAFKYLWLGQIYRVSTALRAADNLIITAQQMSFPDESRKEAYKEKNRETLIKHFSDLYKDFVFEADIALLTKSISDALTFNKDNELISISRLFEKYGDIDIAIMVSKMFSKSVLSHKDAVIDLIGKNYEELKSLNDPIIMFAADLAQEYDEADELNRKIDAELEVYSAQLIEVKSLWKKQNFIPDANRTLRLTYGYIKGYSPRDAVYCSPYTSLEGVIEKTYLGGEYVKSKRLKELYDKKEFGRYYCKEINGLPVALLYNMDTTGGNSGSPVLNAYGEIIGVNFDRVYEATINDYAWNEKYSRSIGVDIRYILWTVEKFSGADHLINELLAGD